MFIPPHRAQNYTTIRLLRLLVKFDGIWRRTPELEHLPWTAFIRCVWKILFPVTAPSAKKFSFSDLCRFCLLSSTKSVPMYLVTCWKYKQSHILISPCRYDPAQLQNCRTRRFLTVFGTLRVTWRQCEEILSPTHPHTHTPQKRVCFVSFWQVRTFHSVWHLRHCIASTVVPKHGPHLVHHRSVIRNRMFHTIFHVGRQWNNHVTTVKHYTLHFRSTLFFLLCPLRPVNARQHKVHNKVRRLCRKKIRTAIKLSIWKITPNNNLSNSEEWKNWQFYRKNPPPPPERHSNTQLGRPIDQKRTRTVHE